MTLVRHVIDARAGVLVRHAETDAVTIVSPPVRKAHDAGQHRIGHFNRDLDPLCANIVETPSYPLISEQGGKDDSLCW